MVGMCRCVLGLHFGSKKKTKFTNPRTRPKNHRSACDCDSIGSVSAVCFEDGQVGYEAGSLIRKLQITPVCFSLYLFKNSILLGFVCFVVINPCVLSANRVDLGFFVS